MFLRKRITIIVLLFACVLMGSFASFAQNGKGNFKYKVPKLLDLNGLGNPPEPDENGYVPILTGNFYPIGFSKNGKFAYYVEPPDEACGCYIAELIIQDLRTDKILWEYRYMDDQADAPGDETLETHWKKNEKKFSEQLNKYGIEHQEQFVQHNPSISFGNDIFAPELDVNIETDGGFEVDGTVTLWLKSKKKGKKIIYEKTYNPKDTNGFRNADVSGVLKSPFESRVAVIIVEEQRGWEGPPNTAQVRIVGSDLTSGFKKY